MPFKDGNPVLSPKQISLMKLCRARTGMMKVIGVFGTRISGKSVGCQNAIIDHLWNTKDASVLVLCYTAGTAATSGIWSELTEKTIPEWIAQGFGSDDGQHALEWEMEPKIHGATKKMICSIRNKFGGVSKLELDSLDDEREVEKKFKSRYYSMIYWSEAGEFRDPTSFTTLFMALRIMGLHDEEHILLIDANPPDNGTEHFLYKFFYELRIAPESECDADELLIRRCLHLTEWTMVDNPFVSDERKALTRKMYEKNPSQYDRYVLGKWTAAVKDALFSDAFMPLIHLSGSLKNPDPLDDLVPEPGCAGLITGHDAGGVNPVSYIIEKVFRSDVLPNGKTKEVSVFKVLDELAYIGEEIQVSEFTILLLAKMDEWEREAGWNPEIGWDFDWGSCWADSSAVNFKESIANRTVADEMFAVSEGRLRLVGVDKGRGSVGNRIRLLRKLLIQNRLLISSSKCPKLIEMLQCICKGKVAGTIAAHSRHKHPFDAITYALSRELWDELQDDVRGTRASTRRTQSHEVVRVNM
jgi:hypothetical protein